MGASAGFISLVGGVEALVPRSGMPGWCVCVFCLAYATGVPGWGKDTTAIASIVYTELASSGGEW